jgi:hypothetical protein
MLTVRNLAFLDLYYSRRSLLASDGYRLSRIAHKPPQEKLFPWLEIYASFSIDQRYVLSPNGDPKSLDPGTGLDLKIYTCHKFSLCLILFTLTTANLQLAAARHSYSLESGFFATGLGVKSPARNPTTLVNVVRISSGFTPSF